MEDTMKPGTLLRLPDTEIAANPAATQPPRPHTGAELDWLLHMLHTAKASRIAIGHGRHKASAAAAALSAAWAKTGNPATTTSWPTDAASALTALNRDWSIALGFEP